MSKRRLVTRMAADEETQRQQADMESYLKAIEWACIDVQAAADEVIKITKEIKSVEQLYNEFACSQIHDQLIDLKNSLEEAFETLSELEEV